MWFAWPFVYSSRRTWQAVVVTVGTRTCARAGPLGKLLLCTKRLLREMGLSADFIDSQARRIARGVARGTASKLRPRAMDAA